MELAPMALSPTTLGRLQQLREEQRRAFAYPAAHALLDRLGEIRWTTPEEYVRTIGLILDERPGGHTPPIEALASASTYAVRALVVILDQFERNNEQAIRDPNAFAMVATLIRLFYDEVKRINDRLGLRDPRHERQRTVGLH